MSKNFSRFHGFVNNMGIEPITFRQLSNVTALHLRDANYHLLFRTSLFNIIFVENKGVEPLTFCVQGRRSSQLS
jgi:hypothetical protein